MRRILVAVSFSVMFTSAASFADTIKIPLSDFDQRQLASRFSKIDLRYRTEEVLQENPVRVVLKKYQFLDDSRAIYIHCSEEFHGTSVVGTNAACELGINYDRSQPSAVEGHDGFMPNFSIVEVKDSNIAQILYGAIANGMTSPSVFFNTKEQLPFTHPQTGAVFQAFRLRIDCKRDASYRNYSCMLSAVK